MAGIAILWVALEVSFAQGEAGGLAVFQANAAEKASVFKQPSTLAELLAIPADKLESVDIALISLLCAEGLRGAENLNIPQCLDTLDQWTRHVESETQRNFHRFAERPEDYHGSLAFYRMGMLGTALAQDLRVQYNPALEDKLDGRTNKDSLVDFWNDFYCNSKDIFLHGILSGKHFGTCSSMPFVHTAIARRLGYPVTIAARKHHLYVRYDEGGGRHLNVETTENLGFATPTDEEYRSGPSSAESMTEEEIQSAGWLRPLSNKEILGICLLSRSVCQRSMKLYDEEIKTLADAARYVPDTPLMKRALQKNADLARTLQSADTWDRYRAEIESLNLPSGGPRAGYFQDACQQLWMSMSTTTNTAQLAMVGESLEKLKKELRAYRSEISDDIPRMLEAFGGGNAARRAAPMPALPDEMTAKRRVVIERERIPAEYWIFIPEELLNRISKLQTPREIAVEMHAFYAEETNLRNRETMAKWQTEAENVPPGWEPKQKLTLAQFGFRPEDVPYQYRNWQIPGDLQRRLVSEQNYRTFTRSEIISEIQRYEIEQQQNAAFTNAIRARRAELDQSLPILPSMELVIISGAPQQQSQAPLRPSPTTAK